jgi:hypothetical protein
MKKMKKMKLKHLILGLFTIVIFSCNNNEKYKPNGLRQVSQKELLENAEKRQTYNYDNAVYKNENGIEISLDSVKKLNVEEWTADSYANDNNEVKELILRKANEKNKEFQKKVSAIYQKEIVEPVIPIEIDCNNVEEILNKVHSLDQDMRTNGNGIDPNIDRENLVTIVSLIEKCGMPTLNEINQTQMSAIWLVFQHADNYHRKKYLPQLKKSAENGDLRKSQMALMEDRILMMDGKPQIYGSQISQDRENGGWKIYDLQNPETVDKRRAEVGLGPLSEYVSRWDIEFNVKQAE